MAIELRSNVTQLGKLFFFALRFNEGMNLVNLLVFAPESTLTFKT